MARTNKNEPTFIKATSLDQIVAGAIIRYRKGVRSPRRIVQIDNRESFFKSERLTMKYVWDVREWGEDGKPKVVSGSRYVIGHHNGRRIYEWGDARITSFSQHQIDRGYIEIAQPKEVAE